jgi:hypothetical protein
VTIRTAIETLVLLVLVIDLLLTAGIIRRLRAGGADASHEHGRSTLPEVGLQVDLARDGVSWPASAVQMLTGSALVAFVTPGCLACERLHREWDAANSKIPLHVLIDPFEDETELGQGYLRTWSTATSRTVAPAPLDVLDSFGRPEEFPTVLLLQDGRVVASGFKLRDVLPKGSRQPLATAAR